MCLYLQERRSLLIPGGFYDKLASLGRQLRLIRTFSTLATVEVSKGHSKGIAFFSDELSSHPRTSMHSCNASAEKKSELGSQARQGEFIRGKRGGDWPLRRISILPFWWSLSYSPPMKNSLKGWLRSQRSGIWCSCSFEKIGAGEINRVHLGNLVSLTDHCDFILGFHGRYNKPSYQRDPMWTLSIPTPQIWEG